MSKRTFPIPIHSATTNSWASVRALSRRASGIEAGATTRPPSAMIITGRRRGQRDRSSGIGDDHQRPASSPVGEDAGEEREDQEGKPLRPHQQPDDQRARVELQDRERGQREDGDLAADDADGLPRPELQEVGVTPEPAASQHCRPSLAADVEAYGLIWGTPEGYPYAATSTRRPRRRL